MSKITVKNFLHLYTEAVTTTKPVEVDEKVEVNPDELWLSTGKYFAKMQGNDITEKHPIVFEKDNYVCIIVDGKITWYDYDKSTFSAAVCEPPEQIHGNLWLHGVTSLEGCPAIIDGSFECANSPELHDLRGGPRKVTGYYNCSQNPELVSLEGIATDIGGDLNCHNCDMLPSFRGLEKTRIGGNLICSYNMSLMSAEGLPPPNKIENEIRCDTKLQNEFKTNPEFAKWANKVVARSNKTSRKSDAD